MRERPPARRCDGTEQATRGAPVYIAQFADSIGLPTDEGIFGFRPFAEVGHRATLPHRGPPAAGPAPTAPAPPPPKVFAGRLAMMGFVTSIVEEALTGRGTLGQLGIESPNPDLTIVLGSLALVATTVGGSRVPAPAVWGCAER
jgi:hypothetical protein